MIVYLHDYVGNAWVVAADMGSVPTKDSTVHVRDKDHGVMHVEWTPDLNHPPALAGQPQRFVPHVYLYGRGT